MNSEHVMALWVLTLIYMGIVWWRTPKNVSSSGFFTGRHENGKEPSLWLLVASAAISWIFAKSIVNAANLSNAFGFLGGVGYGVYYLSFIVAGVAFYIIRTRTSYESLPAFLHGKYGLVGMRLFLIAVGIRLYNEVWSNTKVVGTFFGAEGSLHYWLAALVFTAFTVIYTWRGGLRSSLLTDAVQMVFAGLLLAIILYAISPPLMQEWPQATPDMTGAALTFCLLAFVQIFSYPFHDPVMTDRAFITNPKTMLKGFILAGVISGAFIILFSLVGVFANLQAYTGSNAALSVSTALGLPMLLVFNVMMLTSAGSTLDSTFSSAGKLGILDWKIRNVMAESTVDHARWLIIGLAVLGNLPLLTIYMGDQIGPAIIAATTISGTMVMGLAPVILLSFMPTSAINFHLAFWPGLLLGSVLAFMPDMFPEWIAIGSGKYALTTGINIYGLAICTAGFMLGSLITYFNQKEISTCSAL
ncbi:MAG: Na+/proline symporter [Alphaproteobacteria bacterium CG_4_9_14_3_um_filter_47_13]|nr:MAG: Na+/proline symporter [Alphaproteobacteria bacterium CG_4_9_14_3_um_filter_47_13]